jgi:hypothetical protein
MKAIAILLIALVGLASCYTRTRMPSDISKVASTTPVYGKLKLREIVAEDAVPMDTVALIADAFAYDSSDVITYKDRYWEVRKYIKD